MFIYYHKDEASHNGVSLFRIIHIVSIIRFSERAVCLTIKEDRDGTQIGVVAVFIRCGQISLVYNEFDPLPINLYNVDCLARK